MFTTDDEIDLGWFFLCSASACGMRSTLGGQIDALEASAFAPGTPTTSTVWQRKPKRVFSARDVDEDRILDAAKRERAIRKRLHLTPHHHQVVLELQYGDAIQARQLSLSLLQCTQVAMDSFSKQADKGRRKGRPAEKTVRGWVIRVFQDASHVEAMGELADLIAGEAQADLAAARDIYGRTS